MTARDYSDREKAASIALHTYGLVLFPRDTVDLSTPPLYVLLAFNDEGRPYEGRRFDSIDEVERFIRDDCTPIPDRSTPVSGYVGGMLRPVRTTPYIGQMVHYRSYGTPGGEYPPACRAAVGPQSRGPVLQPRRPDRPRRSAPTRTRRHGGGSVAAGHL